MNVLHREVRISLLIGLAALAGCGPHAHIPPRPLSVPGALAPDDSAAILAKRLAPLLYLQPDETFPLSRVVAVAHPTRPIIAYHLLWRDDVHGAWLPFTIPTDEEVVWVGYDSTKAPTDIWTFWHGRILHADWRGLGRPEIDVQWGKHGSLPRGVIEEDLPFPQKLDYFWLATFVGLPDIWLGDVMRKGPWCFCHGYGRYRRFTRQVPVAERLDATVSTANPRAALTAVFGKPYSKKRPWP
jgi:hypothetical protein